MTSRSSGYSRRKLAAIVSVLTFGLTSLVAVLGGGPLVPAIFITGFFIVVPLIVLLGEDFPLVEATDETPQQATRQDPVETLRDRFARGEIDQAEFERQLEYLVETEGLEFDVEDELGKLDTGSREESRDRELERQR